MNNIIENNKLIAEFMGWKENKDMEVKLTSGGITYYFQKNDEACIPETMCYHSDWNWLMKVVEKIESIEDGIYQVDILQEGCNILKRCALFIDKRVGKLESDTTKIESVYLACIEFIKWYNEQNKK